MRRPAHVLAVATVLAVVATAGCRRRAPAVAPELTVVDDDAAWVVWVPHLGRAMAGLRAFATRLEEAVPTLSGPRQLWRSRLGADILDPNALASVGVDPDSALVGVIPNGETQPVWVLRAGGRFPAALAEVLKRARGADQRKTLTRHGAEITVLGRPWGDEMAPDAYVTRMGGGLALVAGGEGLASMERLLARRAGGAPATSAHALADSAAWRAVRGQVAPQALVVTHHAGSVLGLQVSGDGVELEGRWQASVPPGLTGTAPPRPSLGRLAGDAHLAVTGSLPAGRALSSLAASLPAARAAALEVLRQRLSAALAAVDDSGAARALGGPAALALRLIPGDDAKGSPWRRLGAQLTADVADVAAQQEAMRRLAGSWALAPPAAAGDIAELPLVLPGGGRLVWALTGSQLVVAMDRAQARQGLQLAGERPSKLADQLARGAAGDLVDRPGALAVLRGGDLAEALGDGTALAGLPTSVVGRVRRLLATLGDVVAHAVQDDAGLRVVVRQRLAPPTPPPPTTPPP